MLSIIVATAQNNIIGNNNQLPWHLSEDLKHFKKTTMGCPIIMGRKTFESIGRPLPGRENIVITRTADYKPDGVTVIHGLENLSEWKSSKQEYFIIGGSQIYALCLPHVDRVYLTRILKDFEGDASFPELDLENDFKIINESEVFKSEKDNLPFQFFTMERQIN